MEEISIQELFKILRKRFVFILGVIIIVVIIVSVVSYFLLTPIYKASTQILVTQNRLEVIQINAQDIQTNLQLINTYNVIINSPVILSKVIEDLKLDTTPDLLNKKLKVNSAENSQVVNISVEDPDPKVAANIANKTAEVFQEKIRTLMNIDNVIILSPAIHAKNQIPVRPKPVLNISIAGVMGILLGIGIAFLIEFLDTTIKSEQDIEDALELPIIGLVSPILDKDVKRKRVTISPRKGRN